MATTRNRKTNGGALSPTLTKWLAEIHACDRSGEALKAYAARKGLSVHTLYQARKVLRKQGVLAPRIRAQAKRTEKSPRVERGSIPRFVQAVQRPEVRDPGLAWRLRLPSGLIFESHAPVVIDDVLRLARGLGVRS